MDLLKRALLVALMSGELTKRNADTREEFKDEGSK